MRNMCSYVSFPALIREADPTYARAGRVGPSWITVVGDSDQSIYAFRGADIRNIQDFRQDFSNAGNHRTPNRIIVRRRSFLAITALAVENESASNGNSVPGSELFALILLEILNVRISAPQAAWKSTGQNRPPPSERSFTAHVFSDQCEASRTSMCAWLCLILVRSGLAAGNIRSPVGGAGTIRRCA